MPPHLGQALPRMNIPIFAPSPKRVTEPSAFHISLRQETPTDRASLFSWPDQQRRLALSTHDLVERYFTIFGHLARRSSAPDHMCESFVSKNC